MANAAPQAGAAPPRPDGIRRQHEQARGRWTEVLARLTHVADVLAQPGAVALLRGMGVKNTDTALSSLAREYARASQMALAAGSVPRPHDIMNRARDLAASPADLRQQLLDLSRDYRLLMADLALPPDSQKQRWLEGRALVHAAQARALGRGR